MLHYNGLLFAAYLCAGFANAAIISSISQFGSDVFFDFEGSLNVTDLTGPGAASTNA